MHIVPFPESFDREAQPSYAAADDEDGYSCCFPSFHDRPVENEDCCIDAKPSSEAAFPHIYWKAMAFGVGVVSSSRRRGHCFASVWIQDRRHGSPDGALPRASNVLYTCMGPEEALVAFCAWTHIRGVSCACHHNSGQARDESMWKSHVQWEVAASKNVALYGCVNSVEPKSSCTGVVEFMLVVRVLKSTVKARWMSTLLWPLDVVCCCPESKI